MEAVMTVIETLLSKIKNVNILEGVMRTVLLS
jgi:hypothetical protein